MNKANLIAMLKANEKPVADLGTELRMMRSLALDERNFPLAGVLWGAIDAREKMNVHIGEAIAILGEDNE